MNQFITYDMDSVHPIWVTGIWQQRSFHIVMQEGYFQYECGEIELVEVYLN